jgi:hypothetical protein
MWSSICKFFSEPPKWEEYKNFYQLTIFRYLVMWFSVVPLIAGLLSELPDPLPINFGGATYYLNLELPFNWKILWLSSFFFLTSFGLYLFRCPPFIKKYNQFSDYLAYCHDKRWMAWLIKELSESKVDFGKFLERMLEKGYATKVSGAAQAPDENPKVLAGQTVVYLEFKSESYTAGFPVLGSAEIANEAERGVFWEIFGRYSSSNKAYRVSIRILLLISALLFIFVLGQNICAGIFYIISSLKSFLA